MKVEIKHYLDRAYPNGISKTEKTWKILGIVVKRKIYNYPKIQFYDCVTMI